MTNTFKQWFAAHGSTPGLIACGIRQPNGKCGCQSMDDSCPPKQMEQLLGQFTAIKSSLLNASDLPCCNTWIFDQGQIRFVARPDHWLFALVVQADSEALLKLDELSVVFLSSAD